jgi:hypothetical protein
MVAVLAAVMGGPALGFMTLAGAWNEDVDDEGVGGEVVLGEGVLVLGYNQFKLEMIGRGRKGGRTPHL